LHIALSFFFELRRSRGHALPADQRDSQSWNSKRKWAEAGSVVGLRTVSGACCRSTVVSFDPRLLPSASALACRREARVAKSFLRRPPRARRRPSEPLCYSSPGGAKRICAVAAAVHHKAACASHAPQQRDLGELHGTRERPPDARTTIRL
jgi:hypothetical protein